MNILLIGSGGRENAIAKGLYESEGLKKIFCTPGNPGIENFAESIDLNTSNHNEVLNYCNINNINLVVIGPEIPLVEGLADFLTQYDILVFGPKMLSAKLEGSKKFTKEICEKYKIPTAKFQVKQNRKQSLKYIQNTKFPLIIKADNLASGKGVYICKNPLEARKAINEIFNGKFGIAKKILFEEFLLGEEMSYFIISDGLTFKYFGSAQDHKRVLEGDKGKNTGGMGAYSPSRLFSKNLEKKIIEKIIKPTLKALKDKKEKFKGFLYAGLMIKNNEPYLIEYNVRMGDPECQTILPNLKSDFLDILIACCRNKLSEKKIKWHNKKSICIVLCSKGYPDKFKKNIEIKKLERIKKKKNQFIFHAGTFKKEQSFFSTGGRVLNFVSTSMNLAKSRAQVLKTLKNLNWQNGFFRKDIGYKVINK